MSSRVSVPRAPAQRAGATQCVWPRCTQMYLPSEARAHLESAHGINLHYPYKCPEKGCNFKHPVRDTYENHRRFAHEQPQPQPQPQSQPQPQPKPQLQPPRKAGVPEVIRWRPEQREPESKRRKISKREGSSSQPVRSAKGTSRSSVSAPSGIMRCIMPGCSTVHRVEEATTHLQIVHGVDLDRPYVCSVPNCSFACRSLRMLEEHRLSAHGRTSPPSEMLNQQNQNGGPSASCDRNYAGDNQKQKLIMQLRHLPHENKYGVPKTTGRNKRPRSESDGSANDTQTFLRDQGIIVRPSKPPQGPLRGWQPTPRRTPPIPPSFPGHSSAPSPSESRKETTNVIPSRSPSIEGESINELMERLFAPIINMPPIKYFFGDSDYEHVKSETEVKDVVGKILDEWDEAYGPADAVWYWDHGC